jgi:hypothetical protein
MELSEAEQQKAAVQLCWNLQQVDRPETRPQLLLIVSGAELNQSEQQKAVVQLCWNLQQVDRPETRPQLLIVSGAELNQGRVG